MKGSHALGRKLSGSWHTRPLYVRRRSVQMWFEQAEQFRMPLWRKRSWRAGAQANRSLSWCVRSLVLLGEVAVLLWGLNCPMDCAVETVHSNNGFLVCSTTDSRTAKNRHVSHDAHICACRVGLLLLRLVRTNASARHNAVRIRACLMALSPKHAHGARCVEPNDTLCTELQWLTRIYSALPCRAPLPSRSAFGRIADRQKLCRLSRRDNRNDRSETVTRQRLKPQHPSFVFREKRNAALLGNPVSPAASRH